jgi:hypothetical protein F3_08496
MKKGLENIINNKTDILKERIKIKEKSGSDNINVDFSLFYFPSISLKYFNNCFKNEESYHKFMADFYHKILTHLKDKTYSELETSRSHSHSINEKDKISKINDILDEYIERYSFLKNINMEMRDEFYQIDCLGGKRIIGIRSGNTFYILFFDPYHLIYKDNKFNIDTTSYKNESIFYIDDNIKIFDWEHLLENEKCINCEVIDKLLK